jgi:P-type Cu+ transporter
MVYQLLNENGLCNYYSLNDKPGINQRVPVRGDKFSFLDDAAIQRKLINFSDDTQTTVTLYLPQIHCSSCLYLLENLRALDPAIFSVRVNFSRKEVSVIYDQHKTTLRKVAELLTSIGYEPHLSLSDIGRSKPVQKTGLLYQLGVAGFCFANIMLLSFPEYLGLEESEKGLQQTFRVLNVILALPVFFYSAAPFYIAGWQGLKSKFLNIDAPIALAIIVTFSRSMYEIITQSGGGYFDSMSGIVFFMLLGRVLQNKTYDQLSFDRDFSAYFPIAVTVLKEGKEIPVMLPDIRNGETLLIHSEELIPADGIVTRGKAFIDYSFVTGESIPVRKEMGEIVYAGGRQTGSSIELLVIKEVTQSYLTHLWARDEFKKNPDSKGLSFVHLLSRYFTYVVLAIAFFAALYWWFADSSKIGNVITAVLIVACPCALLLSNTFVNGNVLRIFGRNKFYLRNAQAIEQLANADHIVFDKTGTLTDTALPEVHYSGKPLSKDLERKIATIAAQSNHPLSRAISAAFEKGAEEITTFEEVSGKGIRATIGGQLILLGSSQFVTGQHDPWPSRVYVSVEGETVGYFAIHNPFRRSIESLVRRLGTRYRLSVISGDNNYEKDRLNKLFGNGAALLFNQSPAQKLEYIKKLQNAGSKVMMVGDGLNDAGALKQSDVGIAVSDQSNNFTPASDAILEVSAFPDFYKFIRLSRLNKQIVIASFIVSIIYNIAGLFFAVQGSLTPLVAAILMPASSLSILLITFGCSNLAAKLMKL